MKLFKLFLSNIDRVLDAKGLVRADIAKASGKLPQQVYNLFSAKNSPSLDTMEWVAGALDMPVWRLLQSPEETGKMDPSIVLIAEMLSKDDELLEIVKGLSGASQKVKDKRRLVLSIVNMPTPLLVHASNSVYGLIRGYNES